MIWTLKVTCIFGLYLEEECVRVIEVDSRSSLMDLHDAIQDAVDFDQDHLFEFFAGRHWRNRKVKFEDSLEWEDMFDTYASLSLEDIYPLEKGLKLYYHFDFGDDWYFEITRSRKKPTDPEPGVKYPRAVERIGPNPDQYPTWEDDPAEEDEE